MGNVAEEEARLLSERGHEVTVLIPSRDAKGTVPLGPKGDSPLYKVCEIKPLFTFGNAAFVPRLFFNLRGHDVVHLHYPFFGGAESVALYRLFHPKFRYFITYHMDTIGRGWLAVIFKLYSLIILPLVLRRAEKILVSSRDYAESSVALKRSWKRIESKIEEHPFPAPKAISKLYDLSSNPYFVFLGGLDRAHYFKGVDVLIRAFAAVAAKLDSYELHIIGGGGLRGEYENLAIRLGIAERVKFLGSLPSGEPLESELRGARALVLPSIDRSEVFGLVLLQALAAGIPLIASSLPGVRTVASKDIALQVAPGDVTALAISLRLMAGDNALHARLVANIPEKLKKYSVEKYLEVLEKIISNKS